MLGCAGLSLRSYWSPELGSWSKLEPKMFLYSSKSSPLFSVFGKTAVSFLLMRRDAFTHLYTIKCWMCSCIPSRNLGFLPFLAQGQPCRFTALQQEHTRRSWCSCLDIKHHWKNHHWKQKKIAQESAAWTHQMLWALFWVERKWTCVLEKEHGLLSHMCLRSNHWIIIWKTDIVTLLNRMCLYLYLMKCLNW